VVIQKGILKKSIYKERKKVSGLGDYPFSYKLGKEGKVLIYYYDKQIKVISGKKSKTLIEKLDWANEDEEQMILAKITGNFKRGNERKAKKGI
jgi:hypothetical protein